MAAATDSDYRYVNVRRFVSMVRESVYNGIQWAVFEPNDHLLWARLRTNIEAFLRDLCTHREVTEMSHRWHIVRLLNDGIPYREVAEKTGASTATVTRVAQWLNHGMGGYRLALDRMTESA